ncbi:MAG: SAM-dependent methyltransferase [Prevotella sp.]
MLKNFIKTHRNDDIRRLALKRTMLSETDMHYALDQISGWQKALTKLPEWSAYDDIIYPPHISMEQCSSEETALYKADLCKRLCNNVKDNRHITLTDLTGGFAVDFSYMSHTFDKAVYVEQQEALCRIAEQNMNVLKRKNTNIVNDTAEHYLENMDSSTVIFIDPARRDNKGERTYAVTDCTPNVLSMVDSLLDKSLFTIIKLSPMLDWKKAVADFGPCCGEVHIVSSQGECKELLLVISKIFNTLQRIYCVSSGTTISYTIEEAEKAEHKQDRFIDEEKLLNITDNGDKRTNTATLYLHEPDVTIMKAGCFAMIAERYTCRELAPNSHLFISENNIADFPGRSFVIKAATTMNKQMLKQTMNGIKKANITTRNFPLKAEELRQRLRVKDGGDTYIFATTTIQGKHLLLICGKK